MKKIAMLCFFLGLLALPAASSTGLYDDSAVEKIKIQDNDIPDGFVYGKIPDFAKKVLQANPWKMDRPAINKLTEKIYPDGSSNAVKDIHVSILANKEHPYGDDIVCYIILFKDNVSGKKEIAKLQSFVGYNNDRAYLLSRENIAVLMFVDDMKYHGLLEGIKSKMEDRLTTL